MLTQYCYIVAPEQIRVAQRVQSLMKVYIYMFMNSLSSSSSPELQYWICFMTMKSYSYKRGSMFSTKLFGENFKNVFIQNLFYTIVDSIGWFYHGCCSSGERCGQMTSGKCFFFIINHKRFDCLVYFLFFT